MKSGRRNPTEYLALEFGEPRPFVHTGWQPSEDGKTYVAPGTPSLPAYKPKRVTELMAEYVAEDLSLDQLAVQVGLSKFHFDRLFKRAIGLSSSRYH